METSQLSLSQVMFITCFFGPLKPQVCNSCCSGAHCFEATLSRPHETAGCRCLGRAGKEATARATMQHESLPSHNSHTTHQAIWSSTGPVPNNLKIAAWRHRHGAWLPGPGAELRPHTVAEQTSSRHFLTFWQCRQGTSGGLEVFSTSSPSLCEIQPAGRQGKKRKFGTHLSDIKHPLIGCYAPAF